MKILSLFDGISCARVALERAEIPVELYWAVEIDKYATQISQKNYPDIIRTSDVKNFIGEKGSFDLIIGGSPCQDLSIAKKNRKGLSGERSGLFWEYVRILNEVKPKYFILENVNSMPKEAKELITKTLGVEPIMINAALVSAQNRKRLFWTNIPNVTQPEDRGILLKDILEENVGQKYNTGMDFTKRFDYTIHQKPYDKKGQALRATDYKGTHNMIRIGQINKGGQGDRIYSPNGKSVGLSALGGGRGAKTGLYAVASRTYPRIKNGEPRSKQIEIRKDEKSNALTSVTGDSMIMENTIIRKLTPIECERLQSLPDNYTEGVSNSQRYKMLGNAFNVDVVAHILSFIK
jgi:DNA (cytosine-5)-methyltransferase 3A